MIHKIFTVYDSKAKAYLPPFFLHATGLAIRAITDCVDDPEHQFYRHPADYTLFECGTFDDEICEFVILQPKITVAALIELKGEDHGRIEGMPLARPRHSDHLDNEDTN